MFSITSNKKLIELCGCPDYAKFDEETDSFVPTDNDATGIIVNNQYYNVLELCGDNIREEYPIAEIQFVHSGAKFLFDAHVKAVQSEEDIITVEDAIIDLNGTTQEDLDDIREAIFDLANQMANQE